MDLGGEQVDVDAVVGEKIAIELADGNGTQQRRRAQRIG